MRKETGPGGIMQPGPSLERKVSRMVGYGADVSSVKVDYRDLAEKNFLDREEADDIREMFAVNMAEWIEEDGENKGEASYMRDYFDGFESSEGDGCGFFGALAWIINNREFGRKVVFRYDQGCLFVPRDVFTGERRQECRPGKEDVERLLQKYVAMVTDEVPDISYLEIRD